MAKLLYNQPSPLETRVVSKNFALEGSETLDVYLANHGWKAFLKAKAMTPEAIIEEVKTSALRGRGGAGFPTGLKWSFVPRTSAKPRVLVVNADESEPGTCKDRLLIEYDPHQLIEGIAIAALAVDAHVGYIYIRGEYRYLIEKMDRALKEAYQRGYLGNNIAGTGWKLDLYTHTGAGAYECGEETALLDSLEGKRGVPRMKPPFPAVAGAWAMPTLLNNVETFSTVPAIIRDGGAAFAALGGFPDQPLMEDVEITSRLKKLCAPLCLRERVITSGRRWQKHGVWRTIWLMWRLRWQYYFGAKPAALHKIYYGK